MWLKIILQHTLSLSLILIWFPESWRCTASSITYSSNALRSQTRSYGLATSLILHPIHLYVRKDGDHIEEIKLINYLLPQFKTDNFQ